MKKEILVTRPNHDDITEYLSVWSQEVIDFAKERDFNVIDFSGKKANRKNVEKLLKKRNPTFIFFNGHGDSKTILGYKNEPLIEKGVNDELLKSKIVYSLVCDSAKELGKECVDKKGTISYIGYTDKFTALLETTRVSIPKKDILVKAFFEPSNAIPITLTKGKTTGEAFIKSQNLFQKQIDRFSSSEAPEGTGSFLPCLTWDKDHQVLLGDENAKIV